MLPVADRSLEDYPAIRCLRASRLAADTASHSVIAVPPHASLSRESEPCRGSPFVLDGQVRAAREPTDGHSTSSIGSIRGMVWFVSPGCLFGSTPMSASGATATTARLVVSDRHTVMAGIEYPAFRAYLLGRGRLLHTNHQRIADEIGTRPGNGVAPVEALREQGHVRLARERVEIVDPAALWGIAGG
jgi:CRP/FNR family transcriptional regulator